GAVTVAATARDVNSPLALFQATDSGGTSSVFTLAATPLELNIRPGKRHQLGDVNNDGVVNNTDAAIILAVVQGVIPPDVGAALRFTSGGDVNRDGRVDEADAAAIEGFVVGLIPSRGRR